MKPYSEVRWIDISDYNLSGNTFFEAGQKNAIFPVGF